MKLMKWEDAKKEIATGKVFLEFTTTWCPDCKMMEHVVNNVENEFKDEDIKWIQVDAEEANLFRDPDFNVLKVPSFFTVNEGKQEHIGYEYLPFELLTSKVKEII